MEKSYALNPRDVGLVVAMSQVCQSLRRFPEAIRYADRAIALDPGSPWPVASKAFMQLDGDGGREGPSKP